MPPAKEKCPEHNVRKYVREYAEVTSIQGLRYLTEKRTIAEKVVWAVVLIISLTGCIYMIDEILYKYVNRPVVVSFATEETPIYQIPFPAITICPETKYSKDYFNYEEISKHIRDETVEEVDSETLKKYDHLSLLCKNRIRDIETVDEDFFETIDNAKLFELMYCTYEGFKRPCEDLFIPVITDKGICQSFNIFSREEIFKPHVYQYKNYSYVDTKSKNFFDIEAGYKANVGIAAYPRRAASVGAEFSFTIALVHKLNNSDFVCTYEFQGFRVLVHSPWQVPRLAKHFFWVPLGKNVLASIEPEMIETSETVRKFDPEKKKCFMKDERQLEHFNFYSQSNCLMECLTNLTFEWCGCVGFYMPRNNKTAICGPSNVPCLDYVETQLYMADLETKIAGKKSCDCKPSCIDLKYKLETTQNKLYDREYGEAMHGYVDDYAKEIEVSLLQIYFKDEQFIKIERNELYGITDLISNLGGLLGLFTGFSLLTLVEIIYFCLLRPACNKRMYGDWTGPPV